MLSQQLQPQHQNLLIQNLLPSQQNRQLHHKQPPPNKHQQLLKKLQKPQNQKKLSQQLKDLNLNKNTLEAEVKQESQWIEWGRELRND